MNLTLKLSFLVLLFSIACQTSSSNLIIDVPQVVDKNPEEIRQILGDPDSVAMQPIFRQKVLTYYYTRHDVELRFFNGHASEILVRKTDDIPFEAASLSLFGLDPTSPEEFIPDMLMRWGNYDQFKTVTFYTKHRDAEGRPEIYELFFRGYKN